MKAVLIRRDRYANGGNEPSLTQKSFIPVVCIVALFASGAFSRSSGEEMQDVRYEKLSVRLVADGHVVSWK